ncbi:MAG: caspase family protein [Bacteroidota bacterium]
MMRIINLCLLVLISGMNTKPKLPHNRLVKDYAIFFAVNNYEYLSPLNKPIEDARRISAELEKNYGFRTEIIINPSIDQIDQTLENYRKGYNEGIYAPEGQLLIYFSGHGIKTNSNGYFMAKDSDPNRPNRSGMEYDYYRDKIDQINCQHILVAIDACHSATFDPAFAFRKERTFLRKGEENFDHILANHKNYKSRVFWTSDATGNESPDNSNFAYKFLEGLRSFTTNSNYLRSSELFSLFLEKASPKPGGGRFGEDEPSSCFLFFREIPDLSDLAADADSWERVINDNTIPAYEGYLNRFPKGEFRVLAKEKILSLRKKEKEQRDLADWNHAKTTNSFKAYKNYLLNHPDGKFKTLAKRALQNFPDPATMDSNLQKINKFSPNLPVMISIPAGSFMMGAADTDWSLPIHQVNIKSFSIERPRKSKDVNCAQIIFERVHAPF